MRRLLLVVLTALLVLTVPGVGGASSRLRGDTRVFAAMPAGAKAAYVFVHPNGRVYAASYDDPAGGSRSRVYEWSAAGKLLRSWAVPGQDLAAEHGVQVANADARGRLVLLETSTASVLTLDPTTGRFTKQATLADLATVKGKPVPNYATWGPGGALYVTDYGQAVIWRVPAGGGAAKVWFASKELEGVGFGTTGIVYRPGSHDFLIGQQTGGPGNPAAGKLYRIPVVAGKPGTLGVFWRSRTADLPDGFGTARSGHVYVANVGLSNQLVELSSTGTEIRRFGAALSGANGSPVPFDGPSNATFLGTRVLVANQSPIAGNKDHLAILDVELGEPGAAIYRPKASTLS
ncbi:SMP-30/gluconolactonase/LRE family protein [Nocardioides marmorisolisilvae]|uniref:SMP-30/Gluconolactonase/LRE-like region domain-containing protein n=1 Tax=Nocardioides marmorisolisilvae TaxID=1542737 RepID=A0A3N0DRL8_9ACTN|nr:hypothetical protein [Nocardioides marmorisolisilvae]RNL78270.1 hypothetical protein EFL95_03940 [Nocardioides marmorisolisilvae]